MAVLFVRLADETAAFLPAANLEPFRSDLGLSYAQAGTVLALIAPGALVGTVFSVAADRHSRRAIAAGGAFGYAASLATFAAGRSFAALALAAFVLGVSSTALVDAAEIALVDLVSEEDLRPWLARANLLGTLGDVAGPALVAGVALAGLSWRVTFGAGAALLAVYGVALALAPLPRPQPSAEEDEQPRASSLATVLAVLGDRRVWVIGALSLLMAPFDEPFLGFVIALLERRAQASAAVATLVTLVGVSGGVLAFAVLARRWAHVPSRRLIAGAAVAMAAGAAAIAVVPIVPVAAAGLFVSGVGLNLAWLAVQHRQLTLRPGQVGTTSAVISVIELAGFGIPAAIGALADRTNLVVGVGAFAAVGVVLVAVAVVSDRAPSPPLEDAGSWVGGEVR